MLISNFAFLLHFGLLYTKIGTVPFIVISLGLKLVVLLFRQHALDVEPFATVVTADPFVVNMLVIFQITSVTFFANFIVLIM